MAHVSYCGNCGSSLKPGSGFCGHCGKNVPERRTQQTPDHVPTPETPARRSSSSMIILGASVAVLAVVGVILALVLRGGDVTAALVARIGAVSPAVEREIFKAVSGRAEASAVPALLKLARSERDGTRGLAMQALGITAGVRDLGSLVDLAKAAPSPEVRGEVVGLSTL